MEPLKHECGVAMIRLLKPLEYYQEKYGTWMYGLNKLYLLMEKQHNREMPTISTAISNVLIVLMILTIHNSMASVIIMVVPIVALTKDMTKPSRLISTMMLPLIRYIKWA